MRGWVINLASTRAGFSSGILTGEDFSSSIVLGRVHFLAVVGLKAFAFQLVVCQRPLAVPYHV